MARRRIVFADNDPDFLQSRCEFLEQHGYRTIPVTNPLDAKAAIDEQFVDYGNGG